MSEEHFISRVAAGAGHSIKSTLVRTATFLNILPVILSDRG
jgi:hypothetical protein